MTQELVRKALRASPDGMTANALQKQTGYRSAGCKLICKTMPDVYIDRWEMSPRKGVGFAPVYMAVEVPANTPRPD